MRNLKRNDMDEMLKPFDRCLVRNSLLGLWIPALYGMKHPCGKYVTSAGWQTECIPYDGNEDLLGTTDAAFYVDNNGKVI